MNWVDFLILAIIGISVLVGVFRGFAREVFALAGWILAGWISVAFAGKFEDLLEPHIASPTGRLVVAAAALFILTLLLAAMLNYLAAELIKKSGLSVADRALGLTFGLVRGGVLVLILTLVGGLVSLSQETWWHQSQLLPYFQDFAVWLRAFMPPEMADHIRYS